MDDLTKAIGDFETTVIQAINNSKLHPAVVELVLLDLLNQVKAAKNNFSGGNQNGSTSEPSPTEGDN